MDARTVFLLIVAITTVIDLLNKNEVYWKVPAKLFSASHLIVDFYECQWLEDEEDLRTILLSAIYEANASLAEPIQTKKFEVQGLSGFALLQESHISVHTWPEKRFIAADVFTCGSAVYPDKAVKVLREAFKPQHERLHVIGRAQNVGRKKKGEKKNN
eukprot:TRINITY_DN27791_c0_g1_i1.p1 TRINITY_DN27791_c0_g1~~TRINITY_DN27791_c0_g1_i1.p1  ORF type:complete len:171 (-),score=27.67 TRINITY_DN27791_c0_g1_i1:31-504(-)